MNISTLSRCLLIATSLLGSVAALAAPGVTTTDTLNDCQQAESLGQMMEQQHQAYPLALDQLLQLSHSPLDVNAPLSAQLKQALIEHISHQPVLGIGDSSALQQRMQETGRWAQTQCQHLLAEARQFERAHPARDNTVARIPR